MKLYASLALTSALISLGFTFESPIDGYGIFIPEWEVEVTPGGPMVVLNGTIEQVHVQLLELNPNWDEDFLSDVEEEPFTDNDSVTEGDAVLGLDRRTNFQGSKYNCYGRWAQIHAFVIRDGIRYLRGVKGKPNMGPGPGNCGRVSCSYSSAIYWCNDASTGKTLESYGSIADGAQFIVDRCSHVVGGFERTSGQVFHKTDWNVIVRGDPC